MLIWKAAKFFLIAFCLMGFSACNPLLNFGVIVKPIFFRSGQPDSDDLKTIQDRLKIKTIINLREDIKGFEQRFADRQDIRMVHIPMNASIPPTEEQLDHYFDILLFPLNYPIWMHCQGGSDRTGVMTAVYRLEFQNWSKFDAIMEMLRYFHIPPLYPALTTYIYHYERRFGAYRETPEELDHLKAFLKSKSLFLP